MIRFFSKKTAGSVLLAKDRLKSVICRDRINMAESCTIEKIRKDIISVLTDYTGGNTGAVTVRVKKHTQSHISLEATVSMDTA